MVPPTNGTREKKPRPTLSRNSLGRSVSDRTLLTSPPEGESTRPGLNKSFKRLSVSLRHVMDDVMEGLKEEEVDTDPPRPPPNQVADEMMEEMNARVGKAVVDTSEFRHLQEEMRASGVTTAGGTKEFLVNMAGQSQK